MNRYGGSTLRARGSEGFALILAILSLMLLTFLGLTLAATTTTELQISSNFRWQQQAYYNAEAGIEASKFILKTIPSDWSSVLPPLRAGTWPPDGSAPPPGPPATAPWSGNDAFGYSARNYENAGCDITYGIGMGAILDDHESGALLQGHIPGGPYQNVNTILGQRLDGAVTLWVRRDIQTNPGTGFFQDDPSLTPTVITVTAEGTAPYAQLGGGTAGFVQANRAVATLQITFARAAATGTCLAPNTGQRGSGPTGANFGTCAQVNAAAVAGLQKVAGAQGATGSGTETAAQ